MNIKIKIVAAITLVLLTGAKCEKKTEEPKPKPTIDAKVAQVCIEMATNVRRPDFWCDPIVDGHRWAYPINHPSWAGKELPAVGQRLEAGWGFPNAPGGVTPVRIPEEGAVFKQ